MKRYVLVLTFALVGDTNSAFATLNPTIYQATGLTPEDILPIVERFRHDISRGGTDNGELPGPLPAGRREIDWQRPIMDGGYVFPHKGSFLTTGPLMSIQISSAVPPVNFSDVDPSYLSTFQPFGSPQMMANVSFNQTILMQFFIPGARGLPVRTYVNGVGLVLTDVDVQGSTVVGLDTTSGQMAYELPARQGDGTLSFLGLSFGDDTWIQRVFIQTGNAALSPGLRDGTAGDGIVVDLVAIDRVIYGEPALVPEPSTIQLTLVGIIVCSLARIRTR